MLVFEPLHFFCCCLMLNHIFTFFISIHSIHHNDKARKAKRKKKRFVRNFKCIKKEISTLHKYLNP